VSLRVAGCVGKQAKVEFGGAVAEDLIDLPGCRVGPIQRTGGVVPIESGIPQNGQRVGGQTRCDKREPVSVDTLNCTADGVEVFAESAGIGIREQAGTPV
jgi:hypothetical protein